VTELSAFAEAQAALQRGDHADVLRRTDAMLAERPGDDAAHEVRARSLLALGRLDEAEAEVNDAVRLDPDEIRYRELLAEVLAAIGDHRDAADEYRRLSRGDPAQAAWTLAEAHERLGAAQPGMGVDAARQAVRLDPGNGSAQLALAQGLAQLGLGRPALESATRAVALLPGNHAARESLADARWLTGDRPGAFEEYRALAVERSGSDRARAVEKARTLYRQGAGRFGRLIAAVPGIFGTALRAGWIRVR
jgi:tetratricopeptide (TPR) repeat protein